MSEWSEYILDDFADINPRESLAKGKIAKKYPMDVLGEFKRSLGEYLLEEYKGGTKFRNGDTLLARITPCLQNGKTAFVDGLEENEIAFGSTEYIVLREKTGVSHNLFLYYLSISPALRRVAVKSMTGSSGRQRVQNDVLKSHIFNLPPLPEQKAIAHILGTLDDKIELNRKMNQTLEAMAQALFKSWFVDFDPVLDNALAAGHEIPDALKAKAEKRKALLDRHSALDEESTASVNGAPLIYSNPELAKLFPSSFAYNETLEKWVPEGWEVKILGVHLDTIETGRRPKGGVSKYSEGVPSIGAESINGIGQFEFSKTKFVPVQFYEKMKAGKVEDYDVLLYKDGGKPGDFKPRIGMFGEDFPFSTYGINEHVFRLRSKSLGQFYLYYQLSSEKNFHDLAVMGGKAAIPGVNQSEVKSLDFLTPPSKVLSEFNGIVNTQFTSILKKSKESLTLSKLRDTLLPQLISGKMRVPEEMIEENQILEKT